VKMRHSLPVLTALLVVGLWGCEALPRAADAQPAGVAEARAVEIRIESDHARIHLNGRPFTTFHFHTKWDKPFLHPIRTAGGTLLSRGYPVDPLPGETEDHNWHRGIWFGHGDINGQDFWRELGRDKTARLILHGAPEATYSAKDGSGTLTALLHMQSVQAKILGSIRESFTFRPSPDGVVIDVRIEVAADRENALRFGDTDDGGFGIRLRDEFREDRGAHLANSNGLTGTGNIWGKPARWVHYAAQVEGKMAGVAVFDHPSNLRHPTTWHARGYGLFAANPFGLASFTRDKSKDGSHTIAAGSKQTFQYRVLIIEGQASADKLDSLFADYAAGK
jgi:hypothetical protein